MTDSPLVSIVLPTYNGSRYLREAIQSCVNQTYKNWELIIVDDASTDHTPQIIKDSLKSDRRIACIRHERNKKLPAALNTGFSQAKGKYFTWISDDNLYRPEALSRMVTFLEDHLKVGVVYTDYTKINKDGEELEQITVSDPETLIYINAVGASFLYRGEIHGKINCYDESLFLVEDYDFWLRVSQAFLLAPLHEDLYCFRSHEESLTSTKALEIKSLHERLVSQYLPRMTWVSKSKRSEFILSLAIESGKQGFKKKTLSYVYHALSCAPSFRVLKTTMEIMVYIIFGQTTAEKSFSLYRRVKRLWHERKNSVIVEKARNQ